MDKATRRRQRGLADGVMMELCELLSVVIDARQALAADAAVPTIHDLVMPNGKPLRNCTFGELQAIADQLEAEEDRREAEMIG